MKKLSAFGLSIVLLISMLTVSATAQSTYSYQPVTLTNRYGDCYSFSAACIGYGISYETDGGEYTSAAIILKNNSSVTVTQSSGGESYVVMGWNGGKYVADFVGDGLEDGRANVEEMFHYYISWFGYDLEDSMAYFVTAQGQRVVLLTECAAQRHSDMLIYPGPEVNFGTPAGTPEQGASTSEGLNIFFDDGWDSDVGVYYQYTIKNTADKPIDGNYMLMSYTPRRTSAGKIFLDLHPIDVTLQPGASLTQDLIGTYWGYSCMNHVWIRFENKAERDEFLRDKAIYSTDYFYSVQDDQIDSWLKTNFGITVAK